MPTRRPSDSLHALLHEAEADLSRRLHEACEAEAKGVSTESSEEIRRLEDTLLSAAMAAERTIAARRHLRDSKGEKEQSTGSQSTGEREPVSPPPDSSPTTDTNTKADTPSNTSVREFEDETGRSWRAWPVIPGIASGRSASRRSLGDFQEGWICFEALDHSGRRRLPQRGRRWSDLTTEELPRLLEEAVIVPQKKTHPDVDSALDIGKLS